MKKLLLSAASTMTLIYTSAVAADLAPIKSNNTPVTQDNWLGVYAGLNAGAAWGNSNSINFMGAPGYALPITLPGRTAPNINYSIANASAGFGNIPMGNAVNFIGGAQVGYNWRFLEKGIFSLETDFQGLAGQKSGNTTILSAVNVLNNNNNAYSIGQMYGNASLDYFGTVRGRLGYKVLPSTLLYATAGFAYGGVSLNATTRSDLFTSSPDLRTNNHTGADTSSGVNVGWTAGAGAEWMFMPNWSAKAEYLYYDLGSTTIRTDTMARIRYIDNQPSQLLFVNDFFAKANFNGNIARLGVNYHFSSSPTSIVSKF